MLWTDALFVSEDDLASVDPEISELASDQSIELAPVIQRGIENAGRFLEGKMIRFSTFTTSRDMSTNHIAAVLNVGIPSNNRRRTTLEQVVVSGRNATFWSELKTWAVNRILVEFYTRASNRSENDRYEMKRDQFRDIEQGEAWPLFKRSGVPLVYQPMRAPGAVQARNPGSWVAAEEAGSGTFAGTVRVAITFLDAGKYISPTRKQNAESAPSAEQTVTLTNAEVFNVDITDLTYPDGTLDPADFARGFTVPLNASHWNVYAAKVNKPMRLQNASPIPIATKTWAATGNVNTSSPQADEGQYADLYMNLQDLVTRG